MHSVCFLSTKKRDTNKIYKTSKKTIDAFQGEHIQALSSLIKSIQPKRKHNVGLRGAIVGSVASKMFEAKFIAELSSVLTKNVNDELKQRADNIITFMTKYEKIRHHIKSIHRLEQAALDELSANCEWLGENFHTLFPKRIISPKLHMLFIHVPQFARKHKNLGLFSESAFESVHAEFNNYDRTFASVTKRLESLKCIWRAAEVRRVKGFGEHKPPPRICPKCHCEIAKRSTPTCTCEKTRENSAKMRKVDDEQMDADLTPFPLLPADDTTGTV